MKKFLPYIITLVTFIIISVAYFSPILEGKQISQSDIIQFKGSSKEIADYREKHQKEPYWTNTSFGGMPAYNVSALYPNNHISKVDKILRFLPRPADYLFLYFFGFFFLLTVLKVEWKLAILGALTFGFSTYFIIILGVGHNAKAHAIAYFPLVLSGILLVFKKRYLFGFIITTLAMALEINTGHPQMTYYLLFMVIILGIVLALKAVKTKSLTTFLKQIALLIIAVILGIGMNATSLMATNHYAKDSTRSKSELTITPNGQKKEVTTGLDKNYITEYSYGFLETFNLFIPRFMGGGSSENVGENSNTYNFINEAAGPQQALEFSKNTPTYWGKQPYVSAPAYIGAIAIFLFVLGIFLAKKKYKKWLIGATVFSLLLSYGKNFGLLTNFFIDYVPFYNKFRAVTSIQVIAELAIPLLGILGLKQFFSHKIQDDKKLKALKLALYIVGGLALFFTIFGQFIFDFNGQNDRGLDKMLAGFSDAIITDRKALFFKDSLRSLLLVLITATLLWAFIKKKIDYTKSIIALTVLVLFDLVLIDRLYVNNDNFVDAYKVEKPFTATGIDKEILKDKSHYRVINFNSNPMNEGRTSYFHNSVGGYHAAKPRRYKELFDFQLTSKMNEETLNMLNTKYLIFPDEKGREQVQKNEEANGNAWFVNTIKFVSNADEEIKALDNLNTKTNAVIAMNFKKFAKKTYVKDSTAIIKLTKKETTKFTYNSFTTESQFAVFSEMYFDDWVAYIDGIKAPILRVNYVLRGLEIPSGKREIVFDFQPKVVSKGNRVTLISYITFILVTLGWFFMRRKNIS
ncbi:MAG: YfhO family protein [Flavobacteriaceae bacterium]